MADFRGAGKSIGGVGKGKKWIIILLIILAVLFLIKREAIIQKFEEIKNNITTTFTEKRDEISEKFEEEEKSAEVVSDDFTDEVEKITIYTIDADTVLVSSVGNSYVPENMIDGDRTTSWQEGAEDFGEGNNITISFDSRTDISYIVIYNGNQYSEEYYYQNNRLKDINIIVEDEDFPIELEDAMDPQIIKLDGVKECENISLEIVSVYAGSKYNDTCVSEIECYK